MPRKTTQKKAENMALAADNDAIGTASEAFDLNNQRLVEIDAQYGDGQLYDARRIITETRFYLNQSAEAMLEAGKRLILLKEHEQHGQFQEALNEIGIAPRAAQKMMQAAVKFSGNKAALVDLGKGKMLELMTEDDDKLDALADGGTIAGLSLDEIDRMSARQLRDALRDERVARSDDKEVHERMLEQKDKKINQLHQKLHEHKKKTKDFDYRVNEYVIETMEIGGSILSLLDRLDQLRDAFLTDDFGEENEAATKMMAETYYDAMFQVSSKTDELQDACENVFSGYKE